MSRTDRTHEEQVMAKGNFRQQKNQKKPKKDAAKNAPKDSKPNNK